MQINRTATFGIGISVHLEALGIESSTVVVEENFYFCCFTNGGVLFPIGFQKEFKITNECVLVGEEEGTLFVICCGWKRWEFNHSNCFCSNNLRSMFKYHNREWFLLSPNSRMQRQCHFCVSAECALFIEGVVGCVGRGLEKRWWMYKVRITLIRIMFTGLAGFIFDVLAHFHGSCSVDFWCTCCLPICSATISGSVGLLCSCQDIIPTRV